MSGVASLDVDRVQHFLDRIVDLCGDGRNEPARPSVEALAKAWRELGLRPGDRVILALPNGVRLLEHFFAVLASGGVPALVSPVTPSVRLRELCGHMNARAVAARHLDLAALGLDADFSLGELRVGITPARPEPASAAGEVVQLTSGTCGFPSGCLFDLDALLRNAGRHADAIGQRPDDTVLVTLPLHFSYALVAQALAALLRGGTLVIAGPPFTAASYLEMVDTHRVTVSSLTPVGARALLAQGTPFAPALRVLTVGGDALPAEQVGQLLARRPDRELYITYGLTQCGPRVSTLAAHREPPERYSSVGLPLPGTRTRLEEVDDASGMMELLVSSDTVMKRRVGLVEGRAQHDWASPGVIATGDLFEQDGDGYLYFRGRRSDFIIRRGEKISLATVRRIACQIPNVVRAKATVLQRPDGESDYDLTLGVDGAGPVDEAACRAHLRASLLRREWPHEVRVIRLDGGLTEFK